MLRTSSLRTLSQTLELGTFQSDISLPSVPTQELQGSGEVSFPMLITSNSAYDLCFILLVHKTNSKVFLSLKPNGNHARAFHAGSVASWLFQVNRQGTCLPSFSLTSHEVVTASTSGGCAEN